MKINTFEDMYLAELQELASAESQLGDSLGRMAEAVSHAELKNVLIEQQERTQEQQRRLLSILRVHGVESTPHTDQAMQALVKETRKMLNILKGDDLRDAGLIASIQRLKHYEIAAYGTLTTLAAQLGFDDDVELLDESLDEEKEVDGLLTRIARREVNLDALASQSG
jgi:ferritin-like metal-binding protein YciE